MPFPTNNGTLVSEWTSLYLQTLNLIIETMDKKSEKSVFQVMGIDFLFMAIALAAILLLT